ncbi:MAG: hypothetical protein KAK00_00740 [Nanoarchaeota archaeon]|nr:hypothetical protein [Nanoarchaeota archaeon]
MFGKKKKEESDPDDEPEEEKDADSENASAVGESIRDIGHLTADVEKLKAQFSTFYELNKANTERFTRINEQIGEMRTMMLDRDKGSRMLEAKATQAIDMVQSVQPDRLMIEVRKGDAKVEALRANLESNEMMINSALSEIKEMRNKLKVFTGMEQAIKLNEEIKGELAEIRKTSVNIQRHSDKVETIFSETQKRFGDFMKFVDNLKDLDKALRDLTSDLDSLKTRATNFADKKDVENLVIRFNNFEKHISGLILLSNKKFRGVEKDLNNRFDERVEKIGKLLSGFELLAQKTPDLDKYFNLLDEEAKKMPRDFTKIEKIKVPGEEEKEGEEEEKEKKPSLFKKLKDKIIKKEGKE